MKHAIVFKKKYMLFALALLCVPAAFYLFSGSASREAAGYTFVPLSTGTIESTISSSGTLSPVTQVEIGTQVSGTISRIFVDFNDRVHAGQVLAVIDTSVLVLAVTDAQSGYMRADASLEEAEANAARGAELFRKGMLSASEYQSVKTTLKTAQASMTSAHSALERAKQNFTYAIIRSPIDGTVTARSIEVGQTVAASFATPTLFIIAQDLSKMEIKALVDESDIGLIVVGQDVRFTVQAYPKRTFVGTVKQVRVQPTTNSNVVNYTVVVSADNRDNLLLPGMTATVTFVVNRKTDVLRVPNAALRFTPGAGELAALARLSGGRTEPPPDGPPPAQGDMKRLYFMDSTNTIAVEPVLTGITDGSFTEILRSRTLKEGMSVISGSDSPSAAKTASSAPKMQNGPPGGMPPPM